MSLQGPWNIHFLSLLWTYHWKEATFYQSVFSNIWITGSLVLVKGTHAVNWHRACRWSWTTGVTPGAAQSHPT